MPHFESPPVPPGGSSLPEASPPLPGWLSAPGRSRSSQSILRATSPSLTSPEPQSDTRGAPRLRPRPRQAARSVTHLLARLGRRVVVGCGAGCSCHRVGQILGRSIRLGVIHHLRTTHGSRGSGGPRAAAAGLRARATRAAAAASVAAPAATAARAGPRRPRAPCGARALEGLAISGSPCAGTFIFSPSGGPLVRAHRAAWERSGPPRRGGMTVPGPARAAAAAVPARVGQLCFASTQRAPRAVLSPTLPAGRGPGRRGRGRGPREAGSALPSQALTRRAAEFLQLSPRRAGHPAGGPPQGPAADWSEV